MSFLFFASLIKSIGSKLIGFLFFFQGCDSERYSSTLFSMLIYALSAHSSGTNKKIKQIFYSSPHCTTSQPNRLQANHRRGKKPKHINAKNRQNKEAQSYIVWKWRKNPSTFQYAHIPRNEWIYESVGRAVYLCSIHTNV